MASLMKVGVVGAGAMGAGIAQVAALFGHEVVLADAFAAALPRARAGHEKAIARDVEKGRLTREAGDAVLQRFTYVEGVGAEQLAAFAGAASSSKPSWSNCPSSRSCSGRWRPW